MPRRCACAALLAALSADPRLRTLPLATRALWLLLAEAMQETGGTLPFRSPARIALLVSAPEPEVETQLETLLAEGLLIPDGAGLSTPLLGPPAPRAEAARINGRRGGRPRVGETAEQARARRQGTLLLPVAGTAPPETQETQAPEPASRARHDHDDSSISGNSHDHHPRATVSEALGLAAELADLAGMDSSLSAWDARTVQGWLAAGADAALCREVVADVMTRAARAPGNFRYFERPIRQALEARAASRAARQDRDRPLAPDVQAILDWANGDRLGPMPQPARTAA